MCAGWGHGWAPASGQCWGVEVTGETGWAARQPRSWAARFGLERSESERGIGPYQVGWRTPVASATKRAVRDGGWRGLLQPPG